MIFSFGRYSTHFSLLTSRLTSDGFRASFFIIWPPIIVFVLYVMQISAALCCK